VRPEERAAGRHLAAVLAFVSLISFSSV
jgi:hypothetical protein